MNMYVHQRAGIQGHKVLVDVESAIDIPEEFYEDLERMRRLSEALNNARIELGRLIQVQQNLVSVCNNTERNLTETKKGLLENLKLTDGEWVIDFENKQIGRMIPPEEAPKTHVV